MSTTSSTVVMIRPCSFGFNEDAFETNKYQQKDTSVSENEIQVAIVTYTGQIGLVRGVLDHTLGAQAATQIPIRGNDRSWRYEGDGSMDGKQPHMASAVEELESRFPGVEITKATTLLIDDDAKNIRYALNDGTRAIWFNPRKPHHLLQNIMKLV